MKNKILFLVGLVLSIFLVSACGTQQPTVTPGNQINDSVDIKVNEPEVLPPGVIKTPDGYQLPMVVVNKTNTTIPEEVNVVIINQTDNNTVIIEPINTTNRMLNLTGNYSNNFNST